MKRETRVVLITANGHRHRFVARQVAKEVNLVGIVSEAKRPIISDATSLSISDRMTIDRHFDERDAAERRWLGAEVSFPDTDRLEIDSGKVNDLWTQDWIQERGPELILLYGSSIIEAPLLDACRNRVINLHLGLSPYYRGSATNFWPLVSREPECVGATIHLAAREVDSGAILAQVRPEAESTDRAHDLGTKTIVAAARMLPRVLTLFTAGRLEAHRQDLQHGRVYRNRDFTANAVRAVWHNLETQMMAEFLSDREGRCRLYPIHELAESL